MFIASKLLWWFAQPTKLWVFMVCLGILLLYTKRLKFARRLLSIAGILLIITLVLPIHTLILRPLEQRFPIPDLPEHSDGIVVLGGSVQQGLTELYGQVSLNQSAERLTQSLHLTKLYPQAKLLFTGGSAAVLEASTLKEADVAKQFYLESGLEEDRILIEREARNTFENVVFSKTFSNPDETWLLVTSAFHMPRSVGIFREQSWDVIPYPVDHQLAQTGLDFSTPFTSKLELIDTASKEWLGLIAYRLMGRTSALFPKPESAE